MNIIKISSILMFESSIKGAVEDIYSGKYSYSTIHPVKCYPLRIDMIGDKGWKIGTPLLWDGYHRMAEVLLRGGAKIDMYRTTTGINSEYLMVPTKEAAFMWKDSEFSGLEAILPIAKLKEARSLVISARRNEKNEKKTFEEFRQELKNML